MATLIGDVGGILTNDTLIGGNEDDSILGVAGDDFLQGGIGADFIAVSYTHLTLPTKRIV